MQASCCGTSTGACANMLEPLAKLSTCGTFLSVSLPNHPTDWLSKNLNTIRLFQKSPRFVCFPPLLSPKQQIPRNKQTVLNSQAPTPPPSNHACAGRDDAPRLVDVPELRQHRDDAEEEPGHPQRVLLNSAAVQGLKRLRVKGSKGLRAQGFKRFRAHGSKHLRVLGLKGSRALEFKA